jgi:hypothetical protein
MPLKENNRLFDFFCNYRKNISSCQYY